jgi:hypothetical protein
LCAAAYERWLRMCKRNPNRCIFGPRPRNKAKTAMQSTYDEPDDLFDPPENKLMRLAAVGPFKLAQSKRRV